MLASTPFILALAATVAAHTGAFSPGMFCRGGNKAGEDNQNTNTVVNPLYQLSLKDFWFQHDRGCDAFPPPPGEFLELPANGKFTSELAHNRAFTTLSYGGSKVTDWPDGGQHPDDWTGWTGEGEGCIQDDGALHVQNETSATGTAFAISYESDISRVTLDNLAVFTIAEHTPFRRLVTYEVPDLPACPPEGCTCAWLWVPKGCGQPNMYMQGFKCIVTGATATHAVAPAKPPVFCGDDPSKCVKGAKSMIVFQQAEANNVVAPRGDTPVYNARYGYFPGAQKDIFVDGGDEPPVPPVSSSAAAPAPPPASSSKPAAVSSPVKAAVPSSSPGAPSVPSLPSSFVADPVQGSSTLFSQVRPTPSVQSSIIAQPVRSSSAIADPVKPSSTLLSQVRPPPSSSPGGPSSLLFSQVRPTPTGRPGRPSGRPGRPDGPACNRRRAV